MALNPKEMRFKHVQVVKKFANNMLWFWLVQIILNVASSLSVLLISSRVEGELTFDMSEGSDISLSAFIDFKPLSLDIYY